MGAEDISSEAEQNRINRLILGCLTKATRALQIIKLENAERMRRILALEGKIKLLDHNDRRRTAEEIRLRYKDKLRPRRGTKSVSKKI